MFKYKKIKNYDKVNYIYLIAFPRSGLCVLQRMFKEYFETSKYKKWHYCEYYSCCKNIPCIHTHKSKIMLQKNHDYGLDVEISPDKKYVVLYKKDIVLQLESYFRYHWHYNLKKFKRPNYDEEFTYGQLESFVLSYKDYYNQFLQKWVNTPHDNVLAISCDEFFHSPVTCFRFILSWCEIKNDTKIHNLFTDMNELFQDKRVILDENTYKKLQNVLNKSNSQ